MTDNTVTINNEMTNNIWVIITENEKHVIETKTKTVGETDFETYYHIMVEGKAALPIEGVPIEASGKESTEFKLHLKQYWENNKEAKYQWNEFIIPGELEIAPKSHNDLSRKADESSYFVSIRTIGGRILANSVRRQEGTITINPSGYIDDETHYGAEIGKDKPVFLQIDGKSHYVGDPQTANNRWDAGTVGNTAGTHKLVIDKGNILANAYLQIYSASKTLADAKYKFMYSTDTGNVYYDMARSSGSRAGRKQLWKISKTAHKDNSPDEKLHFGDRVKISNANWPKANLGANGKWLQCINDDATIWILSDKRTG